MTSDLEKLKSVVHYICALASRDLTALNRNQLHKILWLADAQTYLTLGQAIVGDEYTRGSHGPVSAHLDSALRELVGEGHLAIRMSQDSPEYLAGDAPQALQLSAEQLRTLDEIVHGVVDGSGQVSDSAGPPPWLPGVDVLPVDAMWQLVEVGESIPYQQSLVSRLLLLAKEDQEWIATQVKGLR